MGSFGFGFPFPFGFGWGGGGGGGGGGDGGEGEGWGIALFMGGVWWGWGGKLWLCLKLSLVVQGAVLGVSEWWVEGQRVTDRQKQRMCGCAEEFEERCVGNVKGEGHCTEQPHTKKKKK